MSHTKEGAEHRTMDEGNGNLEYKILLGEAKISEYARMALLVPSNTADNLLQALRQAKQSYFDWSIDPDETVTDVASIPESLAHAIRTIGDDIPTADKTESELLDWLIHGESYFSYKYVVLDFMDGKDGPEDGYTGRVAFEIRKEKYMPFYDYCQTLYENSYAFDDTVYLEGCNLLDRATFLKEFQGHGHVVDREMFKSVKEAAEEKDVEWAQNHRFLLWQTVRVDDASADDDDSDEDFGPDDGGSDEGSGSSGGEASDMEMESITGSEIANLGITKGEKK